jgi:3-oxoacyl-[acyl-carrier protein] reductase
METHLRGKVIFITGASGGIGSGIARKFAAEQARLVLHCNRHSEPVHALARELSPCESLVVKGDLRREGDTRRCFAQALRKFGRIDTLIANAGAWETEDRGLEGMPLRQWRKTLDGVLTTTFLSSREFLRIVKKQKQGNIVLIASTAAIFGEAGHADYSAGKAAVAYGLTRSLKNELNRLAPHTDDYCGGRINCVCPGWTVVPRLAAKLGNTATIQKVTATMALPQLGRPEDIGNAAVFFASDYLARHVTGQVLVVAGGMEGRLLWQPGEVDVANV